MYIKRLSIPTTSARYIKFFTLVSNTDHFALSLRVCDCVLLAKGDPPSIYISLYISPNIALRYSKRKSIPKETNMVAAETPEKYPTVQEVYTYKILRFLQNVFIN
jgi:hypothetical protein